MLYKMVLILSLDEILWCELLSSTFLWYCLLIMLCKVVLTFGSVYEILWCDHSNESYTEQYMVALTFESVYEILWCDHLNESY